MSCIGGGWLMAKVIGITNPAKVIGVSSPAKVMGVTNVIPPAT